MLDSFFSRHKKYRPRSKRSARPPASDILHPQADSFSMLKVRWLVVVGLAVLAGPLSAQRTTFNPRLALSYIYRSNIDFVGVPERDDSSLRLTMVLPVVRSTKTGSARVQYRGYIERFDEFSDLDDVGHRLTFGVDSKPGQRSAVALAGGYLRTQDQSDPTSLDSTDLFLTERLLRTRAFLDLGYRRSFSRRWGWRLDIEKVMAVFLKTCTCGVV